MRKTTQARRLYRRIELFWLAALAMLCLSASAQSAPPASQNPAPEALPSDPKALMLLAAQSNGLAGPGMNPWHIKVTFKAFDEKGIATDQGTVDELWAGPAKSVITFTDADSTETDYSTEKGHFISGNSKQPFSLANTALNAITNPLPNQHKIDQLSFIVSQHVAGTANLACANFKDANGYSFGRIWCFDANRPILRLVGEPLEKQEFLYNRILKFEGHYVAGDLLFTEESQPRLTAHIESIETVPTVDETAFTPPHDAAAPKLTRQQISVASELAKGFLIKIVMPDFPAIARASRFGGTVVIEATIGIDGHIKNLHVISGPATLQQSALDAVNQWI